MIKKSIIIFLIVLFSLVIVLNMPKKSNREIKTKNKTYYATKLVIDKINLKQNLYVDSLLNDVNVNLQVLSESSMPSDKESHIYIAGHNGNTNKSFFKDLEKLTISDFIKLYYKDKIYYYEIVDKAIHNKTGTLILDKLNYDSITLITCTKNSKKTQDVYTAKLVKVT